MAEKIGLEAVLQDKDFQSGLAKMIRAMDQAGTQAEGAGKKIASSWQAAMGVFTGNMMTRVVDTLTSGLKGLTIDALPLESIAAAFDGITQSSGTALEALRAGSQGMVRDADLMKNYNTAAQLVGKTFADQLPNAMQYLTKVSAATGQSMSYMMESLTRGVGRMSPLILDNLGIQVNLTEANEKYAASLGKSADQLTKSEQQAALMADVMEKLKINTAAMPDVAGSAAQQWAAFGTTIQNIKDQFGLALIPAMSKLTGSLQGVAGFVLENKDSFAQLATVIGEGLVGAITTATSIIQPILTWLKDADPATIKMIASFGLLVIGISSVATAAVTAAPLISAFWIALTGPAGVAVLALAGVAAAAIALNGPLQKLQDQLEANNLRLRNEDGTRRGLINTIVAHTQAEEANGRARQGLLNTLFGVAQAEDQVAAATTRTTTASLAAINAMTGMDMAMQGMNVSSEAVVTAMQTAQMAVQTTQGTISEWVSALPGEMMLAVGGMTTFVSSFAANAAQMGQLLGQTMQQALQAQQQFEGNLQQLRTQANQQALEAQQRYATAYANLVQDNNAKIADLEMAAGQARTDQQKAQANARLDQGRQEADRSVAQLQQQYAHEQALAAWNTQVREMELRMAYAKEQALARETALAKVAIQNTSSRTELAILAQTLDIRHNALVQSALFEREVAEWKMENDRVKGESEEAFTVRMGLAIKARVESIFGEIESLRDLQAAYDALYAGRPIEPPALPPLPALPSFDMPSVSGAIGETATQIERTAEEVLSNSMDAIAGAFDKAMETLTKLTTFKPVQVEEKIRWLIDWIRDVQEQMWNVLQTAAGQDAKGGSHDWLEVSRNVGEQGQLMANALSGLTAGIDLAVKLSTYKGGSVADKLVVLVQDLGKAQEEIWRLSDTYLKQGHGWQALENVAAQGGKLLGDAIGALSGGVDLMTKLKDYTGVTKSTITRFIDDLFGAAVYMGEKMPTIDEEILTAATTFKTFGESAFGAFSSGFDLLGKLAGGYKSIENLPKVLDAALTDLRAVSTKFVAYFQLWDEGTIARVTAAGERADLWGKLFAPLKGLVEALRSFSGGGILGDVGTLTDNAISAARTVSIKLVKYFDTWDQFTYLHVGSAARAAEAWNKLFQPIKTLREALGGTLADQEWGDVGSLVDNLIAAGRQISIKLVQYFDTWDKWTFLHVGHAGEAAEAWSKLFEPVSAMAEAVQAIAGYKPLANLDHVVDSMISDARQISKKLVKYFDTWDKFTFLHVENAAEAAGAWGKMFEPVQKIVDGIKAMIELPMLKSTDFSTLSQRLADYAVSFMEALRKGAELMGGEVSKGIGEFSEDAGKAFQMAGDAMSFLTGLKDWVPQAGKFQVFNSMLNFMLDELEILAKLHPVEELAPLTAMAEAIGPVFQALNDAAEWLGKLGELKATSAGQVSSFFAALSAAFSGMQGALAAMNGATTIAAGGMALATTGQSGGRPLPSGMERPEGAPLPSETTINVNFYYNGGQIGNISGRLGMSLNTSVDAGIILATKGIG